jgi:hypothetical protein
MRAVIARVEAGIAADLQMSVAQYRDWLDQQQYDIENADGPVVASCFYCGRLFGYERATIRWAVSGTVESPSTEPGELSPLAEVRTFCSDLCADRGAS